MKKAFYPTVTKDGSLSLYNTEIEDIYHSSIGACTEAMSKFTQTSGILDFVKNKSQVNILDICYGLGYNSKVTVSEILKINPECKIHIDALEIDPHVLALSCLISDFQINSSVTKIFSKHILRNPSVYDSLEEYLKAFEYKPFIDKKMWRFIKINPQGRVNYIRQPSKARILHNIYYRTVSSRNNFIELHHKFKQNITLNIHVDDARNSIKHLSRNYDYIFHDGFTPAKLSTLWSVEFFRILNSLLTEDGNLTTYSSSAAVRGGMIEAGFLVGKGNVIGNKSFGTVCYKNENLIKNKLNEIEEGLLKTKAGIPYYDSELCSTSQQIIENREQIVKNSDLISSSRFLKSF